ncbi:MAG: low molecular weight protein-tyrosine-phosphatase [Bacteroidota bacterium]
MKILMVCLGNICRSPMAEGVLRFHAEKAGKNYIIDSAGTSNYHIGENPDARAVMKMKKYGIDISRLRARQFSRNDFLEFDLILAMDENNYRDIVRQAKSEEERMKVKMILEYTFPGERMPVPDPYYGGDSGFEQVYRLLDDACKIIIEQH